MRRREFISLITGATAWPLAVRAQQPALPVVGFLHGASPDGYAPMVTAFHQGLKEAGYVEGHNVAIEYRWAEGHNDRLPALAADLVRRQVAGIVTGGTPSAFAAKAATSTIPIVFSVGIDPVRAGLVASLNRPGGNVTGVAVLTVELAAKRVQLLHELLPTASVIAVLFNPTSPLTEPETSVVQDAARSLGLELHVLNASTESEIDKAFRTLVELRAGALIVSVDPFLTNQRAQIVALAARHAVPAIYGVREFAIAGGLMSYGNDLADAYRQEGIYAGKILSGAKPADLPVQQVVKSGVRHRLKDRQDARPYLPEHVARQRRRGDRIGVFLLRCTSLFLALSDGSHFHGRPSLSVRSRHGRTRCRLEFDKDQNEIYAADGYGNHRVAVLDADTGAIKRVWGAYGRPPTDDNQSAYDANSPQFANPVHCIALSKDGLVFVCDRANNRVQVFHKDGSFVRQYVFDPSTRGPGSSWGLAFSPLDKKQDFFVLVDGSNEVLETVRREDGLVVGSFGRPGRNAGEFHFLHVAKFDLRGNLYTGEVDTGKRLQKWVPVQ